MRSLAGIAARVSSPVAKTAAVALLLSATLAVDCVLIDRAEAGDLVVRYDQSQLLRLPRAASEIIIGNPSIADVSLQGGNLVVVTGKTFGITNIIALDAERNIIQDQRVMVERDDRRVVNLHKGSERYTFACTPNCEPTLTIGDDKNFFDRVQSHNASKTKFSEGAADSSSANANGN